MLARCNFVTAAFGWKKEESDSVTIHLQIPSGFPADTSTYLYHNIQQLSAYVVLPQICHIHVVTKCTTAYI